MVPTKLYVKKHSQTGLLYFGKTTASDPYSYKGSGKYWTNHIKKHGTEFVETVWISESFNNESELVEFAIAFSEIFDIVNSDQWANLKEENGLDGSPKGVIFTEEHRKNLSDSTIGKKKRAHKRTVTVEGAKKRAAGLKGRTRTQEERDAISRGRQGIVFSDEHRAKLSEAAKRRKRKPHTEEARRKMSEAKRNTSLLQQKELYNDSTD